MLLESAELRAGIASHGSFGPLSERQLQTMRQRDAFFADVEPHELEPLIEPLVEPLS